MAALALLACGLAAPPARAQAFDAVRLQPAPAATVRSVGLAAVGGRAFSGSSRRDSRILPLLDYQWQNGWFAGTSNGIGLNLSRNETLDWGFRLTADFGRQEDDSPELRGLGDIDPALEIGAFANWTVTDRLRLTSSLRRGAGNDRDGLVVDLGLDGSVPLGDRTTIGARLAASAVNGALMRASYGVAPAQSLASGLAPYAPSGGWRDARLSLSVGHALQPALMVSAAITYTRLLGNAADSPLVRDAGWAGAFVAVSYAF